MKFFRVYYEEMLCYEDYVEALTAEQAKEIFSNTLQEQDGTALEPIAHQITEFEAEPTTV